MVQPRGEPSRAFRSEQPAAACTPQVHHHWPSLLAGFILYFIFALAPGFSLFPLHDVNSSGI